MEKTLQLLSDLAGVSDLKGAAGSVHRGCAACGHLQSKVQMVRVFKTKAAAKSQEAAQVGVDRNASGS